MLAAKTFVGGRRGRRVGFFDHRLADDFAIRIGEDHEASLDFIDDLPRL